MWRKPIALTGVCAILITTAASASAGTTALQQSLDRIVAAGMPGAIAANGTEAAASGVADVTTSRRMGPGFMHRCLVRVPAVWLTPLPAGARLGTGAPRATKTR